MRNEWSCLESWRRLNQIIYQGTFSCSYLMLFELLMGTWWYVVACGQGEFQKRCQTLQGGNLLLALSKWSLWVLDMPQLLPRDSTAEDLANKAPTVVEVFIYVHFVSAAPRPPPIFEE